MRKIEILEQSGIRHGKEHYLHGDLRQVPDQLAAYFCAMGWAKDVTGDGSELETGARPTNATTLDIHPAQFGISDSME